MLPINTQGKVRAVPESSADLQLENVPNVAHTTSDKIRYEAAGAEVPKVEGSQVGISNTESVAEENKPQRTRSRPLGPRPPVSELSRRPTRRETQAQDSQRRGQEDDRFQRPIRRPSGPRDPARRPTTALSAQESYGAMNITNMSYYSDNFYEHHVPFDIGTSNSNRSQGRESEVTPMSRFDWTSSESNDGRGRVSVNKQEQGWKKRWRDLKKKLNGQKAKVVRSIKAAGAIFKEIGGRRS